MSCSYDDMCAPFLKPEHRGTVSELFAVVTREAVSTYLRPPPRQQQPRCATRGLRQFCPRLLKTLGTPLHLVLVSPAPADSFIREEMKLRLVAFMVELLLRSF